MTNVYSLDGILVFGLLFVCTCAYFKKVPRLKTWLLSEKKGVWGVFYKAAVIGTRLHAAVAIACVVMAFYVLFIKWIPKYPSHQLPTKGTGMKNLLETWTPCRRVHSWNHQSPEWHHSISPCYMWGKLMDTNIMYASGDYRKPASFDLCVNQSLAECIWCPDKLHPSVIRLHTSFIKTYHLVLFFSSSSGSFQTGSLGKELGCVQTSFEDRIFKTTFHSLIWIWQIGEGMLGGKQLWNAKIFFGFRNSFFMYPSGNIKERHSAHCKKRTDEVAVLCAGILSFAKKIWAYIKFENYLCDETRKQWLRQEKIFLFTSILKWRLHLIRWYMKNESTVAIS